MQMINEPKIQSNTIKATGSLFLLLDESSSLEVDPDAVVGVAVGFTVGILDNVGAMDGTKEFEGIGGPIINVFEAQAFPFAEETCWPNATIKINYTRMR